MNFSQPDPDSPTTITWKVEGLTPGLHGFHIHEKADFSEGCKSAGPHYNPFGMFKLSVLTFVINTHRFMCIVIIKSPPISKFAI